MIGGKIRDGRFITVVSDCDSLMSYLAHVVEAEATTSSLLPTKRYCTRIFIRTFKQPWATLVECEFLFCRRNLYWNLLLSCLKTGAWAVSILSSYAKFLTIVGLASTYSVLGKKYLEDRSKKLFSMVAYFIY